MHGLDAFALQFFFEPEIEIGRIDTDKNIRLPGKNAFKNTVSKPKQAGQVFQYFGQAHYCQFLTVMPRCDACLSHQIATDTDKFGIGIAGFYFRNQSGPELVAGGFACNQGKSKWFFRCLRFAHGLAKNAAFAAIDELQHHADIVRSRCAEREFFFHFCQWLARHENRAIGAFDRTDAFSIETATLQTF